MIEDHHLRQPYELRSFNFPKLEKKVLRAISSRIARVSGRIDFFLQNRHLKRVGASAAKAIPTWTTKYELKALSNIAAACRPDTVALEIGSYLGASACYLVAGLAQVNGHLYCVDTWHNETIPGGERDTFAEFQNNTHGIRKWITPIRKRVEQLSETEIKLPLNLVFIDGDHSYAAVKHDFKLISKWIAEDGIIAFHDCVTHKGVSRVIGEALGSGEWRIAGKVDNLLWIKRTVWEL